MEFFIFYRLFKKIKEKVNIEEEKMLVLKIPNKEVKFIFREKISKWFNEKIKNRNLENLYNAIVEGNTEIFQKELSKLLRESISFNDTYENFYHGFLLGILMNMRDYKIKSNYKEAPRQKSEVGFHTKLNSSQSVQCQTGNGRSDIYIKSPSLFEKSIIIEIKVADSIKNIRSSADDALKQIEEKKYDMELKDEGYEDILKYGIAFYKKDCIIKKL